MGLALWETALISGAVYLVYLVVKFREHAVGTTKRSDGICVPGWPIIGNMYQLVKWGPRSLEWATARAATSGVGTYITVPGVLIWDLTKPDWIEYIQKTNFDNYVKGKLLSDAMKDVLGDGIFASDGATWHFQRKTTSHIFTNRSFRGVVAPAINDCTDDLNRILSRQVESGNPIDLANIFFRLTLEGFSKMAFGQSLNLLSSNTDEPVPFAVAFDFAQARVDQRLQQVNGWAFMELFSETGRKMKRACQTIDEYAYRLIDNRQREVSRMGGEEEVKKNKDSRDLLGLYMDARDEKGQGMNRKQLRDAVLSLIIAGRDTTAQALAWTFYHLMRQPQLVGPLREEVEKLVGDHRVDFDNYRSLIQVNAVLNEALRLHPSVPKNAKMAVADDQIPGGPAIKAGDWLRWSDWQMARNPEVWGEDCRDFKPSRWIDDEGKLRHFGQWKFHAFNGGPRLCLGMNLATFEAVAVIVEIIRNFDLTFAPGWYESVEKVSGIWEDEDTPLYNESLTLPMRDPMMVTVKKRVH